MPEEETKLLDPEQAADDIDFGAEDDAGENFTPESKGEESASEDTAESGADNAIPSPEDILKGTKKDESLDGDQDEGEDAQEETDPDVDDIPDPEFKSEDSKTGWQNLKQVAKERKQQLEQLQAKVDRYEKGEVSQASQAQVTDLQTRLEEAQKRLASYDVRESPEFQNEVEVPVAKNLKEMEEIASEFEADVSGVKWDQFRGMTLKQAADKVREIADGDDVLQSELMRRATEVSRLSKRGNEILANAEGFSKQAAERRQVQLKQTFDQVSKDFDGSWAPIQVADDAGEEAKAEAQAYNDAVSSIRAQAEQIALGQTSPEDIARVAHEASQFRFMMKHGLKRIGSVYNEAIQKQAEEINTLKAKLEGVTRSKPTVDGRADKSGANAGLQDMDNETAAQQIVFG